MHALLQFGQFLFCQPRSLQYNILRLPKRQQGTGNLSIDQPGFYYLEADVMTGTLTATLPALGITRTFIKGVLKSAPPVASAARTIQPTTWVFDFERVL